jgi:hypothetical protein
MAVLFYFICGLTSSKKVQCKNAKKLNEKKLIKVYEKNKSTSGPNVVESIGLPTLKKKCRHFSEWITKLEGLV